MSERAATSVDEPVPTVTVNEGDYVFCAGDTAGTLFILQEGRVELLKADAAGGQRLALLEPGDVLGEESAFGETTRGCDARAVTAARMIPIDAATFRALVAAHPEVATGVIAAIGRRLFEARAASAGASRVARSRRRAEAPAAATPARPAVPRLVHVDSGVEFALPGQAEALVGRADPRTRFQPEVELSSVDTQRSLSRRHARILRDGERFLLVEESRVANGTFINGQQVPPSTPMPIVDGDEVCFGLIRTIFRTE